MALFGRGAALFRSAHCLTSATKALRSGMIGRIATAWTSMHVEFLHLAMKRGAADAEQGRRLRDVAVGARQHTPKRRAFRFRKVGTAVVALLLQNIRSGQALRDKGIIKLASTIRPPRGQPLLQVPL